MEIIQTTCKCGLVRETVFSDVLLLDICGSRTPLWAFHWVPFSVYSLISVEVRLVSKNCSCSWSARGPDCLSLLVHSSLLADQYSPAHFCVGFGETKCYISLYSQLFISHSRSTRLLSQWVSGWEHIKICDITDCCFIFCWDIFPLGTAAEVFVLSTDIWLVH